MTTISVTMIDDSRFEEIKTLIDSIRENAVVSVTGLKTAPDFIDYDFDFPVVVESISPNQSHRYFGDDAIDVLREFAAA